MEQSDNWRKHLGRHIQNSRDRAEFDSLNIVTLLENLSGYEVDINNGGPLYFPTWVKTLTRGKRTKVLMSRSIGLENLE
jgi:hypothetical protein